MWGDFDGRFDCSHPSKTAKGGAASALIESTRIKDNGGGRGVRPTWNQRMVSTPGADGLLLLLRQAGVAMDEKIFSVGHVSVDHLIADGFEFVLLLFG